jgi:hypothetical protein
MEAATAAAFPRDRVCNWRDEMQRILGDLPTLPPSAQRAVRQVLASIVEEDEAQAAA